jgi:transcriptional regulator with XRE-family HTH domain
MVNLREIREKANLSQTELAARTGVSQVQISRYEQNPDTIPLATLISLLQGLGLDLQTAIQDMEQARHPENPLDPGRPYTRLDQNFQLLRLYLDQGSSEYAEWVDSRFKLESVIEQINFLTRRPKLVIAGAFDTGKSHLINRILGKNLLPTGYTPMTKVAMYIHHADEKPEGLHENVVILGENFNPEKWNDLEHIQKHAVARGNALTLKDFGTHEGENELADAQSAIVFDDAPILKACCIVDTPGLMNNDADRKTAVNATRGADLLIFTSQAKGFMKGEDIALLEQYIGGLPMPTAQDPGFPALRNLFIVATQADPSIGSDQLQNILTKGGERLFDVLGETTLRRKGEEIGSTINKEILQGRFFSFWSEIPDRRKKLEEDLCKTLADVFPKAMIITLNNEVLSLKKASEKHLVEKIKQYEITKNNLEEVEQRLADLERQKPQFQATLLEKKEQVYGFIREREAEALTIIDNIWGEVVTIEKVEQIIRNKFPDKKEAPKAAPQYILSLIQDKLTSRIESESRKLTPLVEQYLDEFQGVSFEDPDAPEVEIPFDAHGAFAGGFAGVASIGVLAFSASLMGPLGGYILVAKGVSVMSALGFSVSGGTAGAASMVAAIGGPVTLAIGIGIAVALAGWALFGSSWQKRLAKKIVTHFDKENVKEGFWKAYINMWLDTKEAFTRGAENAEKEYHANLERLRDLVQDKERTLERISNIQVHLDSARAFFVNMPWKTDE